MLAMLLNRALSFTATGIFTAAVKGRTGVVGAMVRLTDASGRVVALRQIGSNVGTGCRGPDTVNLAVREPGVYSFTVRYSDGKEWKSSVDLSKAGVSVIADRDAKAK
jgi:hypothetical protein